ncbi:MAG: outer membrane beta-barrel protein [Deltaproteobacteria bacterium]|nr:MAG: outer membrane beta-barrel protein [Deltaproteobacteria bacterium]
MKKLLVVFLGLALALGFAITKAEAGMSAGQIRLGATLLGYDWKKSTIDVEGDPELGTSLIFLGDGAGATVGYCVNDNIEVGGNLLFSLRTDTTKMGDDETEDAMTDMRLAVYLDYNHPVSDQLVVYPEVLVGYMGMTEEQKEPAGEKRTLSGIILGGGGGIKYFPVDKVSLDLGLDFIYGMLKLKIENGDDWEEDASGLELLIKGGVSVYLGGK